ncbi:MAG TPA: hypothetical protein DCX89_06990 [Saprospirales bacterium]|nr:hypothetical protein [Saprospirales bacterium]
MVWRKVGYRFTIFNINIVWSLQICSDRAKRAYGFESKSLYLNLPEQPPGLLKMRAATRTKKLNPDPGNLNVL